MCRCRACEGFPQTYTRSPKQSPSKWGAFRTVRTGQPQARAPEEGTHVQFRVSLMMFTRGDDLMCVTQSEQQFE